MDVVAKTRTFVNYWYKRFLLATELYMVEPWEKNIVYVVFSILFCLFWIFNYTIIQSKHSVAEE